MSLHHYLTRLQRFTGNLAPKWLQDQKRASVKAAWSTQLNRCAYSEVVYDAAMPPTWSRIIEFGANWGGNLEYFLLRHPEVRAVGIDINPVVLDMASAYSNYEGIVGDETELVGLPSNSFDLAFTVSVLDHIPSPQVVEEVIRNLVRVAPLVVLLEPFIEGIHGDVSGRTRNEIKEGLVRGHKVFAQHSYIWNYDKMLQRMGVRWEKSPTPLHAASLGPFYHLYKIRP